MVGAVARDPDARIWLSESGAAGVTFDGFCAARLERAPPIQVETVRAEITDLWVTPERRRRGVGRELVAAALSWAKERGVERCEVRVASANEEGQAFWRALGFGDLVDVLHRRL